MFHFLLTVTGIDTSTTAGLSWYNFLSGIVGDLGLFGAIILYYRKINCHGEGCLRIGHHSHDYGKFHYCKKHHPEIKDKLWNR